MQVKTIITLWDVRLRPSALIYFQNKLVSRQNKWEMTLSVVATPAPAQISEVWGSTEDGSSSNVPLTVGRQPGTHNVDRGVSTWLHDYIKPTSLYHDQFFARRFGIPKALFSKLVIDLSDTFPHRWCALTDATGRIGIDTNVKVMAVLRVWTKGQACDVMDDGARMGKETVRKYVHAFLSDVREKYEPVYLNCRPTEDELSNIEQLYNSAAFSGFVGVVECCHIPWKNCLIGQKGQYHSSRNGKLATIVAEALCDPMLYIWSWFSGMAGTNNDLNVLNSSPLFQDIINNAFSFTIAVKYKIIQGIGEESSLPYFLVDGIYRTWSIFAGPIRDPTVDQQQFKTEQEAIKKDGERAFVVLMARFQIFKSAIAYWNHEDVVALTDVCVILHNMIIACSDEEIAQDDNNPIASCTPDSVASGMEKFNHYAVMSAMEKEVHTINIQFGRDSHPLFTPEEIQTQ